jgi:tetratricopeptide (TPR) repeat protein
MKGGTIMAQAAWHALMCDAVRWRRLKKPVEAIDCLVQAIALTQQAPELSREAGSLLNYLADLYLQEGQLAQAEATIRQALQKHLCLPGPERSLGADDFMILAKVLSRQGRHREAYEAGSQALASFRQQSGTPDKFLAQIQEMVDELKRKRDTVAGIELKPSRAARGAATDRPGD